MTRAKGKRDASLLELAAAQAIAAKAPAGKKPAGYVFGHCATGRLVESGMINANAPGRVWHQDCKATTMSAGKLLRCACECHNNHTICRACGRVDVTLIEQDPSPKAPVNANAGTCVDVEGCLTAVEARTRNNGIWQQVQECKAEVDAKRAERREYVGLPPAVKKDKPVDVPGDFTTERRKERKRPAPRTAQRCHCGCGGETKGGMFVAGHDMRLKGTLYGIAREPRKGNESQLRTTNSWPLADRAAATAELQARGWKLNDIPQAILDFANQGEWDMAPDLVIERAVARRYG